MFGWTFTYICCIFVYTDLDSALLFVGMRERSMIEQNNLTLSLLPTLPSVLNPTQKLIFVTWKSRGHSFHWLHVAKRSCVETAAAFFLVSLVLITNTVLKAVSERVHIFLIPTTFLKSTKWQTKLSISCNLTTEWKTSSKYAAWDHAVSRPANGFCKGSKSSFTSRTISSPSTPLFFSLSRNRFAHSSTMFRAKKFTQSTKWSVVFCVSLLSSLNVSKILAWRFFRSCGVPLPPMKSFLDCRPN